LTISARMGATRDSGYGMEFRLLLRSVVESDGRTVGRSDRPTDRLTN